MRYSKDSASSASRASTQGKKREQDNWRFKNSKMTLYCYVFLTILCLLDGLSLGPSLSSYLPSISCTDYDSSLIPIVTHTSTPTSSIQLVTWTDS
jgi:hypothetical protein